MLLASFDPLMSALRCLKPTGPVGPYAAADLMPAKTELALTTDGLGKLADAQSPAEDADG
ncbi:hypothetical protein [Streptomyces pini]|uniref:Uncharacterized protein n=1 Tax=Streptomyces pini TaxID=1520580 RepID=A0A1I4JST3_9ACTN|nr:hypothetical protein [Streptomyces pini]SFL69592.1 hypothetical protein SAMN05192584_12473 [Streptomyces pini]